MAHGVTGLVRTTAKRSRKMRVTETAAGIGTPVPTRVPARGRNDMSAVGQGLSQLLADTLTLRDLYAKHSEQATGPLARVFELICQRHRVEHVRLAELLAAHIRGSGGDVIVMAADIATCTRIARPPRRRESLEVQIERLLSAHESITEQAIKLLRACRNPSMNRPERDDIGLIASELVLTGKLHVWLLGEHLRHLSNASSSVAQAACIAGRLVLPF